MWETEINEIILPTVSTMIIFAVTLNFFRYFFDTPHIQIRDSTKEHNWKNLKRNSKAHYCSICSVLLLNVDSLLCDCCGICVDHHCVKIADKTLKCKVISCSDKDDMKHHWIRGNLPVNDICHVCSEEIDIEPDLIGWSCCWCQRCVHEICKVHSSKICDFGTFREMIIPPTSVIVTNKRSTMKRKLQVHSISVPKWPKWNPLIVVANKKSGNNDGGEILSLFRRLLNPVQIIDLDEQDLTAALKWCQFMKNVTCNILVAGGDGTISWLLSTIHKLKLKPEPSVAILPLGTGNDLSRVLGWGKEYDSNSDPGDFLCRIQSALKVNLDRWTVTLKPLTKLDFRNPRSSFHMYNYLSIGVDAQVTLSFHRTRQSRFYLFSHRIFNKLLYLCFGTQQVIEKEYKDLEKRLEVFVDGEKIDLPAIESIIILNIPSWAAGVDLWSMKAEGDEEMGEQSINDGKVEVAAIHSSFHMAQLQVGLSQPYKLSQGKNVKIKLLEACAMQVDGEPWYQQPCELNIICDSQASMLMSHDQ